MKKIVTSLIVILPFVFLIALFAITSVASVSADIPTNGLVINNKGENGVFSFDLANYQNKMFEQDLGVEVLPHMAKNKKYSLKVTDANTGKDSNIVTLEEDGSFALHDVGVAKLTFTSKDGGYSDSVVFNVGSSGVLSFNPVLFNSNGDVVALEKGDTTDFKATIEAGAYTLKSEYHPATAVNVRSVFGSENQDKVRINKVSGIINANFETDCIVSVTVKDAFDNDVEKTILLSVKRTGEVMANSKQASKTISDAPNIVVPLNTKTFTLYVDCDGVVDNDIKLNGAKSVVASVRKLSNVSDSAYAIDLTLDEPVTQKTEKLLYTLTVNGTDRHYIRLSFLDYAFSVTSFANAKGENDLVLLDGAKTLFSVSSDPSDDLTYSWRIQNEELAQITNQSNQYCYISALASGKTKLFIDWQKVENGVVAASGTIERDLEVAKSYTSLIFNESVATNGLGKLAIANQKIENGAIVKSEYFAKLFNAKTAVEYPFDNIVFTSSNESVLKVETSQNGVRFIIKDTGEVTVTAEWKFGTRFNAKPASITFNAVNGVYVNDYEELKLATDGKKQIVLAKDVYIGEKLTDEKGNPRYTDAEMRNKLLANVKKIKTTSDYKYYSNLGKPQPEVYVGFEFANNVYGNGHFVSAEYITNMRSTLTDTVPSYALFKGPLNFVAANTAPESDGGIDAASVKGQDNISFLVRKNGIVLDNLALCGCDDSALYSTDKDGNKKIELSYLNEKGTTLEVMCNATLLNCRIKNGRTVVRVFGKSGIDQNSGVSAQSERINVTIDGCRLQTAREFILKVGTNRFLRGNASNLAPSLKDANGNPYTNHNKPQCDDYAKDKFFMDNYVLTDVTLKDSVLATSGLFSVGVESHFSGVMLDKPTMGMSYLRGWDTLEATSYPAILRLVGNVVLDDWKELDQVDSSTLIETNLNSDQQGLNFLSLNIPAMLREVCQTEGYENIISRISGKEYVHGGIALYGGGKNYSIIDTSEYAFESMNQYLVNIGILENSDNSILQSQGSLLPLAAGKEDFRFYMFDASSKWNATSKLN